MRRSVKEYLDTLDDAALGRGERGEAEVVSRSDPAARRTGALKGR
ncbi:hypothetical protein [Mesorhizobium argentiipisi]